LVRRGSPTEAASGGQNNVVRPTAGGSAESCGAGFTPASGGGAVAEVWISAPQAGINPAPQIPRPPRDWRWRRTLWGRLHAGQREWGRCRSVDFTAVGRDKPGPTDSEAAAKLALAQDPVGPALRRPAEVGPLPKCGFWRRRPG